MSKEKLSVVTTFTGIGMQERGIEQTGLFDMEVLNTCELDIDAIISYAAIHKNLTFDMVDNFEDYPTKEEMVADLERKNIGFKFEKGKPYNWKKYLKGNKKERELKTIWLACKLNKNVGDICKVDLFPYCDLFTFSFPCTDISISGKQQGMIKGKTRSGLVYEVLRILHNMKANNCLPKYLLMENVAALVNKRNLEHYLELNKEFDSLGYNCYYRVINAKFCGVPQNRERVFALYVRKDINLSNFEFPKNFDTGIRLKDILEDNVDDSFFVRNEKANEVLNKILAENDLDEKDFEKNTNIKMIRNIKVIENK